MSELLSEEEIGNIVAGLRNGGKFADWPQHTALAFLRLVEAQRDHLKAQGWKSGEDCKECQAWHDGALDWRKAEISKVRDKAVAQERKRLQDIALKAITDEPEFDDEMPEQIKAIIRGGITPEAFEGFAKWAVKETKKGITDRFLAALASGDPR